jgi:hypothetical protein
MNTRQKWIAYGLTGAVGIGILAGAATAAANAMDLRTTEGTTMPGGVITGGEGGVLDLSTVQRGLADSSITVVSAPSPTPVPVDFTPSVASVASAPAPEAPAPPPAPAPPAPAPPAPAAPAPVAPPADSPASAPSAYAPASAVSASSVGSAGSD